VLADFMAEWTKTQMPIALVEQEYWMMYFDESLMKSGAGVRLNFIPPRHVHEVYDPDLFFGL
jgi:hypothetical protein